MPASDHAAVLEQIEDCWREVAPDPDLGLGPDDNLFERGADSFAFIRLIRLVEDQLGVSLPLMIVFEDPRLETIARCVLRSRAQS